MNKVLAIETIRYEPQPNILWVRVHTDNGMVGLGETYGDAGHDPELRARHLLPSGRLSEDQKVLLSLIEAETGGGWRLLQCPPCAGWLEAGTIATQ